jgi:hypothetical protein
MADRGAQRMQARGTYRTMARMQRRRSFVQSRLGTKEDAAAPAPAANEPEYVGELERLSQLRDQGIITNEDFEAKKKQLLGI